MPYDGYVAVGAGPKPTLNRAVSAPASTTPSPSASGLVPDPLIKVTAQQPPIYEYNPRDAVPQNVPPPTYDSIFGPAGSAIMKTTAIITDFGKPTNKPKKDKYVPDSYCEVFWKFVLVNIILCGVPLAQMVVGIIYWDQCPLSNKIPLYMVLNGVGWFLIGVRIWAPNWVDEHKWFGVFLAWVCGLAVLFVIAWFVGGSYWVFKDFRIVEYQPTVVRPEPIVKVDPYEDIDGPFTNNTFIVTTKEGTKDNTLRIKWNGKDTEYLEITGNYIDLCDRRITYKGNGTTEAGDWSIFFNYKVVRIWFNDEIVVNSTKQEYKTCYFWEKEVDEINGGHAAVTVQFKDKALNKLYFDRDPYCNKTLFLFAFICLLIVYAIGGATTVAAFCMQ